MPQGRDPEGQKQQRQQKAPQPATSPSAPPSNQELLAQIARLYRTMGALQQGMAAAASFAPSTSSAAAAEGNIEDELQQQPFPSLPLVEQPLITKQQRDRHELAQYMDGRNAAHDALREHAAGAALSGKVRQDGTAAVVVAVKQRQLLSLPPPWPMPPSLHREERTAFAGNNLWQHAATAVKIISAGEPAGFPEKSSDVYSMEITLEDAAGKRGRQQDDFAAAPERAQGRHSALDAADAVRAEGRRKEAGGSRRFAIITVDGSDNGDDDKGWRLDSYGKKDFGVKV